MTVRIPAARTSHSPETSDLLAAVRALPAGADASPCGEATCSRPGALTLVTEHGAHLLCGLHAMELVFRSTDGPVALVRAEPASH